MVIKNNVVENKKQKSVDPDNKHHYFRTIFAALSGFISLMLLLISILVVWLGNTLTNTDTYVATISSLARRSEVQEFISTRAAEALVEQIKNPSESETDSPNIRDVMSQLIPQEQVESSADEELIIELENIIHDELSSVLESENFQNLWADTNRDIHTKLISQVSEKDGDLELDFHETIVGAIGLLKNTRLSFISDKMEIPQDVGKVNVDSDRFAKARDVYNYFVVARIAIIGCAILSAVITVLVSVHHIKTLRRMMVLTAVFTGVLAMALSSGPLFKKMDNAPQDKDLILALSDVLLKDLRITLFAVSITAIIVAVSSKIFQSVQSKKSSK